MDLDEYQKEASRTDQFPTPGNRSESISIFGLIGEIGCMLTTFKKRLRDKEAYESFKDDLKEEMGDVLWYLSNIASKYNLSLSEVAAHNLSKVGSLWPQYTLDTANYGLFDEDAPPSERLPRQLVVTFTETGLQADDSIRVHLATSKGMLGDALTDNAYADDGYRYHDVFHLAHAAVLGWSPVFRWMTNTKRKSSPVVDEVEDGARAILTEELISLYVYDYAKKHNFFESVSHVDTEVLRFIKRMTEGFEVKRRSMSEWRLCILTGYRVFRELRKNQGGSISVNLLTRRIDYQGAP